MELIHDPLVCRDIVLVYCPQKVGSTSLVTSLRVSALDKFVVFHSHDEIVYKSSSNHLTVSDIKKNNCVLNNVTGLPRKIYVIDIFRPSLERKMSEYFYDLGNIHFNHLDAHVLNYPLEKIQNRFNQICTHMDNTDYFKERFNIETKTELHFDFENKYLLHESKGVTYIKLRLQDSSEWGNILTKLLGTPVYIVNDCLTSENVLGPLFETFKNNYLLPSNFYADMVTCPQLKTYLSFQERQEYLEKWRPRVTVVFSGFTSLEYKLYMDISKENQVHFRELKHHYKDDGCLCSLCSDKRIKIINKIKSQMHMRFTKGFDVEENLHEKNKIEYNKPEEGNHKFRMYIFNNEFETQAIDYSIIL